MLNELISMICASPLFATPPLSDAFSWMLKSSNSAQPCPLHTPKTAWQPPSSTCAQLAFPGEPPSCTHLCQAPGGAAGSAGSCVLPDAHAWSTHPAPHVRTPERRGVRGHGLWLLFTAPALQEAAGSWGPAADPTPRHRCEGTPHWQAQPCTWMPGTGTPALGASLHAALALGLPRLPLLPGWSFY